LTADGLQDVDVSALNFPSDFSPDADRMAKYESLLENTGTDLSQFHWPWRKAKNHGRPTTWRKCYFKNHMRASGEGMLRCLRSCRRVQHGCPRHGITGVSAGWGIGCQRRFVAFEDQGDIEEEAEADGQAGRRRQEHGSAASPPNSPSDLSFVSRVVKFFAEHGAVLSMWQGRGAE
jgi:hypothetical protein